MIARKRFSQQKLGKQFYQVIFSVSKRTWTRSLLTASLLALLSFPVWQQTFTNLTLPIQVQMATDNIESVRAYWNDPVHHSQAYERISVASTDDPIKQISTTWRIKVQALAQKEPQAKSSQVWVLDIRTPENRIDWSKAVMLPQQWQLLDAPNSPQGKAAVALTEKPQSLQATIQGSTLTITLLRHPWSGKVRVTVNDQVRELDLFAADSNTENLSFKPSIIATKKPELYKISVVKTPWHRLRFVPEPIGDSSTQIRVDSIQIGDTVIRPEVNSEFVLPFYFWNQISCAIAATILSFLSLTVLLVTISNGYQQNPDFLKWNWFAIHNQPRAILKIKIVKWQFLILPYQSFKYLLIALVLLGSGLFIAESYFSPLETGKIVKIQSQRQNYTADLAVITTSASQSAVEVESHSPKLASRAWHQEDDRIFFNNNKKILNSGNVFHPADGDWIWRSKGFPVSQVAQKSNRILVMGDSFVWGDGYANMNDIWWRQLQRELIHRGYNDVEVIAAGLNGASTREELEQARHLVQTYNPNLMIWGYVTNDPDERIIKTFDTRLVSQDEIVRMLNTLEAKEIFPRISGFLNIARTRKVAQQMSGDVHGYEYSLWERKILEGRNFELYRETVKSLAAFQTASKIPGFVMTLPSIPIKEYFASNYGRVIPLFQSENIPVYNTLDDYLKYYLPLNLDPVYGWRNNPANGHPAAVSTYFYAVKAADILEADYSAALGKQQPNNSPPVIRVNDWVPYNLNPTVTTMGAFTFQYPTSEEAMLRLPVKRPFVQLNLEFPVTLKEIRLAGTGLNAAALDLTVVDSKLKFDDGTVYSFEPQAGHTLVWNLEGQTIDPVNTIRLSANFKTPDRTLTLTLIPTKAGSEP